MSISAVILRAVLMGSAAIATSTFTPSEAQAQNRLRAFDIPAQDAARALNEWARQAGAQIVFPYDAVAGRRSAGLRGRFSANDALDRLIAPLGLQVVSTTGRIVTLRAASVSGQAETADQTVDGPNIQADIGAADNPYSDILVTGTRIRGAVPTSPVISISQADMRQAGQNNLGDVIRALPQSYAGGQNPGVLGGAQAGSSANINSTGGSSLNLRGLGPDASLTLLNGVRLPYDGFTQAADLSAIPVAAIERIEILLDGASAIYGSDAIGGVANIILRRDYRGAELSARYGGSTDGGYEQFQFTGVAGHSWSSGGFIVTADHSRNDPVLASQREYLDYLPLQDTTIFPRSRQTSFLLSGHQRIAEAIELRLDAFHTDRSTWSTAQSGTTRTESDRHATIWGIAPSLDVDGPGSWSFRVNGFWGRNALNLDARFITLASGSLISASSICYCNTSRALAAEAEGPLINLPAGPVRVSVGGGYRRSSFEIVDLQTGTVAGTAGSDSSYHAFGEMRLPVIAAGQAIPLARSLSLNAAVRYENYASFGDVVTPKLGVVWEVSSHLTLRGTWGRSFKVPTLFEQYTDRALYLYPGFVFGAPAGTSVIYGAGGNPALEPEKARILTAGVVVQPGFAPGLSIELGWFEIDYRGRIANPPVNPPTAAFTNPEFAEFVTLAPSPSDQDALFAAFGLPAGTFTANVTGAPYDPSNVFAFINNVAANTALQKVSGVDLSIRYATAAWGGRLTTTLNASWLDSTRRFSSTAIATPTSGVAYYPADFRARAGVSWSADTLTLAGFVNRVAGVRNVYIAPANDGDAMTTVDLSANARLGGAFEASLSVINVFDADPPFIAPAQPFYVNYDSTNYSALGRIVSLTLTKRF